MILSKFIMTDYRQSFKRYEAIIPSVDLFYDSLGKALPKTFWFNPLKISKADFLQLCAEEAFILESLKWHDNGFKLKSDVSLGHHWFYLTGLIQLQEEVSMLPVEILAPKSGEMILDLCAAPGNKTAQLAAAMQNNGTVVANDRSAKRIKALGQITKRLGLINTAVTLFDGCNYPDLGEIFDKILVDAPCSCEGTIRKKPGKIFSNTKEKSLKKANIQFALLNKAIQLLKPGGKLVYSTCTFAPEENECVVNRILQKYQDTLLLKPIHLKHFNFSAGIESWENDRFHESLKNTLRVWPHQNDSGGFYVALFEKKQSCLSEREKKQSLVTVIPDDAKETVSKYAQENFGIHADVLKPYKFNHTSKRGIYITNADFKLPKGLEPDVSGIIAMKTNLKYPKLTTAMASLLISNASKNTLQLNNDEFSQYLKKETIEIKKLNNITMGYVLVYYHHLAIGFGFAYIHEDKWYLKSLFPKWGY